jgi:teichuronic acid exporter
MDSEGIKEKAFFGLLWKSSETFLVSGTQTIIFLLLARLLMPADFGLVALVAAFIAISSVLIDSGLGTALIQTKNANQTDYSTVLFFSFLASCAFYLLIFMSAPFVAKFYEEPALVDVLRFYSISIIFAAINGVQKSILLRELKFRVIFFVSSVSVIVSGTISIGMALSGFGVYALVCNSILQGLFSTVAFFIVMKWLPKVSFSIVRLKELFKFSYKILLANLIETGYTSIFPLLIGKSFSSEALGYYNNGRQLPNLVASSVNASINSVVFPVFSRYQSDKVKLKSMVRKSIAVSNFVILPFMALLAATAKPLVLLILTEKWLPSVPYIQLFCVVYGLHHQHNICFQAISAIGRSDVFLKYQTIKKVIGIAFLAITLPFGIVAIVAGQIFTAVCSIAISVHPSRVWLNYSVDEQLVDFFPYILFVMVMFLGMHAVNFLEYGILMTIIAQLIIGGVLYIALGFIFRLSGLIYILETINMYVGGRFKSGR